MHRLAPPALTAALVLATVVCAPREPTAAAGPGPGAAPGAAISLHLDVADTDLGVGETLSFSLAFHNAAAAPVVVVPPLDGSWDGMRQPLYSLEIVDDQGKLVPNALGYFEPGRCGMTNSLKPEDLRKVAPHGALALEAPLAWAAPMVVQPHARPGAYRARVRYVADKLPGVAPRRLVSNEVPIAIRGGDARLWACRNGQVERARDHTYANVTPARLTREGDGYVLMYSRTETRVTPEATRSASDVFAQRLDGRGAPAGPPVVVARGGADWLGLVEALPVPDGVLVAFTVPEGEEIRRVSVAHVATAGGAIVAGKAVRVSDPPGRPFFLALARREDRVGLVYAGGDAKDTRLRFQLLDTRGKRMGAPVALEGSRGTASGRVLLEASGEGYLVAWHQGGEDVRLQWLDGDGRPRGEARRLKLGASGVVAVAERGGRVELVYDDSGVDHRKAGDTMGLHVAILSADGARVLEDRAQSPLDVQKARFGAAAWAGDRMARVYLEDKRLVFADKPGGGAGGAVLSETAGGTFGLWAAPGDDRVLAAWTDFRDDGVARCLPSDCVSEAYVAVLGADGAPVVGPARATRGAVAEPLVLHRKDWQRFCE